MILTVTVLRINKPATVLPLLMKVYTIPCHDRGHINVMFVLQSYTDSLKVWPGSSSETCRTGCNGACDVSSIKVEGTDVKEEGIAVKEEKSTGSEEEEGIDIKAKEDAYVKEEMSIDIKEEIPVDLSSPTIKSEQDEVSYKSVFYQTHLASSRKYHLSLSCLLYWPHKTPQLLGMEICLCFWAFYYFFLGGGVVEEEL